jgi:hypothetical protein
MSKVKDKLLDFTEAVMGQFNLSDDDFDKVSEIIIENTLLQPETTEKDVIDFFTTNIICPQCSSLLGQKCNCSQTERL